MTMLLFNGLLLMNSLWLIDDDECLTMFKIDIGVQRERAIGKLKLNCLHCAVWKLLIDVIVIYSRRSANQLERGCEYFSSIPQTFEPLTVLVIQFLPQSINQILKYTKINDKQMLRAVIWRPKQPHRL